MIFRMNITHSERESILGKTCFDDENESFSFSPETYEVGEINNTKNLSYQKISTLIL